MAPAADAGPMPDKNNIINVREGESLYQICIKLRRRLSGVPGFQPYLEEMEQQEEEKGSDPVSSLWQCFRTGLPLLAIYNASNPEGGEVKVKTTQPERMGKEATFLFLKACMQEMEIPPTDTFTVTELYSDNTTGFVKVTKLINKVLDMLQMSGKLHSSTDSDGSGEGADPSLVSNPAGPKKMTRRDHILKELVDSERHYVHHLQNLQAMKKELEEAGALTGDSIHNIFLNLNNLLDFAQRFLIRIEQQHELPQEHQNWGALFVKYKDPFRQYEPFIANQRRCETTVAKEWDRMVSCAHTTLMKQMLANPTILTGFLLKPFQRLTKYPLLLKDLGKQTEDERLKRDIHEAVSIIQEVLNQADASIDKETREDALTDLEERVDDWKSLSLSTTGELLLLGTFNVQKDGGMRSEEKEYHIYLFARILVLCKDVNVAKQKRKGLSALSTRGKPKMHIKGRIFFANVISAQQVSQPGNYTLSITWKGERGDVSTEMFIVKFKNDETLKKWLMMIQTQRAACLLEKGGSNNVSSTKLTSMQDIELENPYAGQDDDEDYSRMSSTTYGGSEFSMSRNASSTSLRQRSATGSSGGTNPHTSMGRGRIPTGGMPNLPRLNTREMAPSPGDYGGDSYFSPTDRDTPPQSASTRSSAQSSFTQPYRNVTPVGNPYDNYRNTAPAMGRNDPRGNPYLQGRHPARPSLPPGSVHSANNGTMNRLRSASSPDIHPQVQQNRKYANGDNIPAVPSIPSHVSKQMAPPRSQSNSPNNVLPVRSGTPGSHNQPGSRPGMQQHGYTYDTAYGTGPPRQQGHTPTSSQDANGTGTYLTSSMSASTGDLDMPSQLRAKVCFNDNYVSMIIPSNITFRSLTDRIDAKLSRFTSYSIASKSVKLKYKDEDGELVLIDSDDAVQEALLDWKETHGSVQGGLGVEILLYATSVGGEVG